MEITASTTRPITRTLKNRISKKQRYECFMAALPDLIKNNKHVISKANHDERR